MQFGHLLPRFGCVAPSRPLPAVADYDAYAASRVRRPNGGGRAITGTQIRRIAQMYRAGASVEEKCNALGLSRDTILHVYRDMPGSLK